MRISHNIFFSDKEKILFEVTGEEKYCNNTVLKTSDGFAENFTIHDSDNEKADTNELIELSLADGDYKIFDI